MLVHCTVHSTWPSWLAAGKCHHWSWQALYSGQWLAAGLEEGRGWHWNLLTNKDLISHHLRRYPYLLSLISSNLRRYLYLLSLIYLILWGGVSTCYPSNLFIRGGLSTCYPLISSSEVVSLLVIPLISSSEAVFSHKHSGIDSWQSTVYVRYFNKKC